MTSSGRIRGRRITWSSESGRNTRSSGRGRSGGMRNVARAARDRRPSYCALRAAKDKSTIGNAFIAGCSGCWSGSSAGCGRTPGPRACSSRETCPFWWLGTARMYGGTGICFAWIPWRGRLPTCTPKTGRTGDFQRTTGQHWKPGTTAGGGSGYGRRRSSWTWCVSTTWWGSFASGPLRMARRRENTGASFPKTKASGVPTAAVSSR